MEYLCVVGVDAVVVVSEVYVWVFDTLAGQREREREGEAKCYYKHTVDSCTHGISTEPIAAGRRATLSIQARTAVATSFAE